MIQEINVEAGSYSSQYLLLASRVATIDEAAIRYKIMKIKQNHN